MLQIRQALTAHKASKAVTNALLSDAPTAKLSRKTHEVHILRAKYSTSQTLQTTEEQRDEVIPANGADATHLRLDNTTAQTEPEPIDNGSQDSVNTSVLVGRSSANRGLQRMPRSVQAVYLKPLKRKAVHGIPSCDLQLRSYSVRNVEFFADFALRAAYYLHLPALGSVPLPRITERWTVPRSNFIFKKSQENFERITLRRLIQIQDGHPETVGLWLAFLRKHAYYGVGMKANVWEHDGLGVGKTMDISLENLKQTLEPRWAHFGRRKNLATSERVYEMMSNETFRQASDAPMSRI